MASAVGIVLALWLAPAQPPSAEQSGPPEPLLCDIAVRASELDYIEFSAAAGLRLPSVRLREADSEVYRACKGKLHGYVGLRSVGPGSWELSLITSDGRAWFRTVASEPDQASRALASALSNLIAAIEDASVEPDAENVVLPAEITEPTPPPEEDPPPDQPPEDPLLVEQPEEDPPEPDRTEPVLELSPRLSGAVVVGLAPGPGLRGAGGGFGIDLRLPDGLGFGLDVRALTRTAAGVRLVRTRVALGVGWLVRNGMFELPVIISGVIEPWVVKAQGSTRPLGQPPMIGGGLRVAPGLRFDTGPVQVRVGLPIGFEIAVEAARGGVTPAIAERPDADPILRAGGVELSFGLEFGVWIPVRQRR